MSEDFKERLKAYAEGRLLEEDKLLMEKELANLELYQEFLDEQCDTNSKKESRFEENIIKNQEKIIKKSKWKARLQNATIALSIFLIFILILQTVTNKYYRLGNPSKDTLYRNAIKAALQTTRPNAVAHGGTFKSGIFFTSEIGIQYSKKIGKEELRDGNLTLKFGLGKPVVITDTLPNSSNSYGYNTNTSVLNSENANKNSDPKMWNTLEKLPEGTVSEAYITFDKLYETDKVFEMFKNKDLELLWLAVDTGAKDYKVLGFPHTRDFPQLRKNWYSPPPTFVKYYENGKFRNEYFIDTLKFLTEHKSIAKAVDSEANFEEALNYVNKNGVKILGVTITGPTKEILKLREENYVQFIKVGEARLWNWD